MTRKVVPSCHEHPDTRTSTLRMDEPSGWDSLDAYGTSTVNAIWLLSETL